MAQLSSRETESEAQREKYRFSEEGERQGDTERPTLLRGTKDSHQIPKNTETVWGWGRRQRAIETVRA